MLWLERKRLEGFLRNPLRVVPGIFDADNGSPFIRHFDERHRFQILRFGLHTRRARAAIGVITASMLTV
jgi:hypothetical protein